MDGSEDSRPVISSFPLSSPHSHFLIIVFILAKFGYFWQRNWEIFGSFIILVQIGLFFFLKKLNFAKFSIWTKKTLFLTPYY
jgi:hypothetical protein